MALLIDTNIVLDWILKRRPFHESATKIIDLCTRGEVTGYLAAHTVINVFFITRKDYSVAQRRDLSRLLCNRFEITGIDRQVIINSLESSDFQDLEDELQIQCAISERLDYIITRDTKGFEASKIKAISPEVFLDKLRENAF